MAIIRPKMCAALFVYMYINAVVQTGGTSTWNVFTTRFTASVSCNLLDRLAVGCAQLQPGQYRSVVECAARCENNCISVSMDTNHNCYSHTECPDDIIMAKCTKNDQKFHFYMKDVPCLHRGVFNESTQTCQCVGGWVGLHCERSPTSCQELVMFGYKVPQTIWVYINTTSYGTPFKVLCSLFDEFTTSRLMQNLGSVKANRTWQEYAEGFYVDTNNFWIGLEKMKALNTENLKILRFDVQFGLPSGYNLFAYTYNNFRFYNDSSGTMFNFSFSSSGKDGIGTEYETYNVTYTGCLDRLKQAQFSTWDKDNDGYSNQNCAAVTGIGWWYKNDCTLKCNPLGSRNDWLSIPGLNLTSAIYAESMMYFTTA